MKPSPASIAAVSALSKIISEGRVGAVYFAPDDLQIDWTKEVIGELMQAVYAADRDLVLGNWILDLLHDAGVTPGAMLKAHPDYERATKHWQEQEVMDVIVTTSLRALECYAVKGTDTPLAVVNQTVRVGGYGSKDDAYSAGAVSIAGDVQRVISSGAKKLLLQVRVPLTVAQDERGWYFRYRIGVADITGLDVDDTPLEPKL